MRGDLVLKVTCRVLAIGSAAIVVLVVGFLLRESIPALRQIRPYRFVTDPGWHPLSDEYNLAAMIVATLLTSLGAVAIATPLGLVSAVFSNFYAPPWLAAWNRRLVELLAGIPSVVFGLWGLVVLAPIMAGLGGSGQNLFTATIILALMILPTITILSDSAIAAVPREWTLGAAALGMDRWCTVTRVTLPAARNGIGSAMMLALTRALGETMAVLMVAGNTVELPKSIISPGRTLNANIALELGYASASHRSVLFVSGLVLMLVVSVLVVVSSWRWRPSDE